MGILGTLDLGEESVVTRHEVGTEAILSLGFVVRTIVSISLGSLIRRPVPEVPSLVDKKERKSTSEESKNEMRITTSHEVFYRSARISEEPKEISGNCRTISRRESMKRHEIVPYMITEESTSHH